MALQKAVADMRDAVARAAYKGPEPDFAAMRKDTKMPEIVDEFEKTIQQLIKEKERSQVRTTSFKTCRKIGIAIVIIL